MSVNFDPKVQPRIPSETIDIPAGARPGAATETTSVDKHASADTDSPAFGFMANLEGLSVKDGCEALAKLMINAHAASVAAKKVGG